MATAAQTLDTADPATDFSSWTREEIRDLIAEAISDSLDMDWQPSWGADAVLRALEAASLSVQYDLPALVAEYDLLNATHTYHGDRGPDNEPAHSFHDYGVQWGPYHDRFAASGRTIELALEAKFATDEARDAA